VWCDVQVCVLNVAGLNPRGSFENTQVDFPPRPVFSIAVTRPFRVSPFTTPKICVLTAIVLSVGMCAASSS